MKTVFVLVLEHRYGRDIHICTSRTVAEAILDTYVQEFWSELSDTDQPDLREDRISLYFNDHPEDETYSIDEYTVED